MDSEAWTAVASVCVAIQTVVIAVAAFVAITQIRVSERERIDLTL